MRKHLRPLALAAALMVGIQGCYGSFALTRKVWKWNGDMGNKFVSELVFLVLLVLPVYSIASLIDGVIINSVEFWSGKNPMALKTITDGDKMAVLKHEADDSVRVSFFENNRPTGTLVLVKQDGKILAKNANGELQAIGSMNDGLMTVADAKGAVLANSVVR